LSGFAAIATSYVQASIASATQYANKRMLILYLRGHRDLTKRATIRHWANGSNIDDVRCDIRET
jgi:hypothetical protein